MKNIFTRVQSDHGLTIVELLVSLFLTALLAVFVVYSYAFVEKFIYNWKNEIAIYQEAEFLLSSLEKDVQSFREQRTLDSGLVLIDNVRDTVTYFVTHGALLRNNKMLNSNEFTVQSIFIERFFLTESTPDSIFVCGGYDYGQRVMLVILTLQSKNMIDTFQTEILLPDGKFVY